jgi:opacity protein-like surface antigen
MKKNFTILSAILITLFSLNAKAQDEDTQARSYMAIIGGFSKPLGNYASTNYSNNSAGFAQTGTTFGLDFGIYLHKNFGIGITLAYQDQNELTTNDVQNLANGYNASFGKDEASVTSVNRFTNINLMAGPQYAFLFKKFTLELRADAGVIKSISTPSLTIVFDYSPDADQNFYQLNSGAISFAYGGSAGLRYSLSDSWDVGIKFNYIESSGLKIENSGNPGTIGRFQTNMPINLFQSTLGMTLKF